ncbi:hypothetical protein V500_02772 [Pseudogymnoascus sp. VKM F-4518 (FW-2643)]|nr:hypothetical protein V500_02772 [Pseudogymnoascus sp. VKM F-4518 (FW-2643)]
MSSLVAQLEAFEPVFLELCKLSGIPGVSIRVAHHGKVIYQANLGYRDVEAAIVPDADTIYTLGSLTKPITAAMAGLLVDEGKIKWDTQLKDVLTDFTREANDPLLNLTLTDLLSHQTGLPGHDSLWFLSDNRIMMKRSDAIPMFSTMPAVLPFRAGYCYNNFAYEIAGQIIEKLSGTTYSSFLQERILKPLGLTRTFVGAPLDDQNAAKAYMTKKDCTPVEIPLPFAKGDSLMAAAGGVGSSVSDPLKLYHAYMEAGNAELESDASEVPSTNPFKELPGPFALPSSEKDRSQLPLVGKGAPSRLSLYHEGAISGSITFSAVFPETMSSVVVLTNSVPLNYDGPRFIAEVLIEVMFGVTPPDINSFIERSKKSVKAATTLRRRDKDGLELQFHGVKEEAFSLEPYQEDSFTWLASDDELVRRGRFYDYDMEYYIIQFQVSKNDDGQDNVVALSWKFDSSVEGEPERLKKEDSVKKDHAASHIVEKSEL